MSTAAEPTAESETQTADRAERLAALGPDPEVKTALEEADLFRRWVTDSGHGEDPAFTVRQLFDAWQADRERQIMAYRVAHADAFPEDVISVEESAARTQALLDRLTSESEASAQAAE